MNVGHNVQISTFDADDRVTVDSVGVNNDLSIFTGSNDDVVSISNSEASDGFFAILGDGDDTLTLSNTYGGSAILDGGNGAFDRVFESGVNFKSETARNFEPLYPLPWKWF